MSEETKNTETQPNNAAPAEKGEQAGKLFTQDEVNRIVSERLARDREKRSPQQQDDDKETALKAREAKLDCRDYLIEKNYPMDMLEILDTSDVAKFKATVDKLGVYFNRPKFAPPKFAASNSGKHSGMYYDPISDAFKP